MASEICGDVGKDAWPELVGVRGVIAAAIIARENPRVHPVIVPKGSIVTQEISCDRVRVWINKHGIVYKVPVVR